MNADAVQFLYAHYAGSGYVDEMVVRGQMFPAAGRRSSPVNAMTSISRVRATP